MLANIQKLLLKYGMNFVNMPELQWEYGYPAIIIVSILVIIGCMSVFRRKHYW